MQRLAGTRERSHIFWLQPLLLSEALAQIFCQPKTVSPGITGNLGNRFARHRARPKRIFVRINDYRIFGEGTARKGSTASGSSKKRFAKNSRNQNRRCGCSKLQKQSTRLSITVTSCIAFHDFASA